MNRRAFLSGLLGTTAVVSLGPLLATTKAGPFDEGAWTPSIGFRSETMTEYDEGPFAFGGAAGRYIRIGRVVHIQGTVDWSGGPGSLIISGMPMHTLQTADGQTYFAGTATSSALNGLA